jgi:hypothetical protein
MNSSGCTPDAERVIKTKSCERFSGSCNPLGMGYSAQFVTTALRIVQPKVFNGIPFQAPILAEEKFDVQLSLHQNRLELLAPPFLSREKVVYGSFSLNWMLNIFSKW